MVLMVGLLAAAATVARAETSADAHQCALVHANAHSCAPAPSLDALQVSPIDFVTVRLQVIEQEAIQLVSVAYAASLAGAVGWQKAERSEAFRALDRSSKSRGRSRASLRHPST